MTSPLILSKCRQEETDAPPFAFPVPFPPTNRMRLVTVVLSTSFRDFTTYPNANEFTLRLAEPLRNVFALRLMRADFTTSSTTSAYVSLNQYKRIVLADGSESVFFAMVSPGTELCPSVTTSIENDPYAHVLRPPEGRLRNFDVQIMNSNMTPYATVGFQLVLTLTAYCMEGIM